MITPVTAATGPAVAPPYVMTLTNRGSKEQCIFGEAATLRAGGSARLCERQARAQVRAARLSLISASRDCR